MVLYNKLKRVSTGKLYSPHHLAAFIKLVSAIYVTKKMSKLALSSPQFQRNNRKDNTRLQQSLVILVMDDSFQTLLPLEHHMQTGCLKTHITLICQHRLHFHFSFSSWPTSHTSARGKTLPASPASPTNPEIKVTKGRRHHRDPCHGHAARKRRHQHKALIHSCL